MSSSRRIGAVRAHRSRAGSPAMLVHARPRTNGGQPEVAFVAGRRVGGAVQRNRAKRRLRAAARDARLPEADLVVDARSGALDAPFDVLRQDLERLSRQAVERAGG